MARKDLLSRLADAGEEAIGRLGKARGMEQMMGFANTTRDRLDELTRRVRGIDELEQRVTKLEKQLKDVSGGSARSSARSTSSRKSTSSSPKSTSRKSSSPRTGGGSPG